MSLCLCGAKYLNYFVRVLRGMPPMQTARRSEITQEVERMFLSRRALVSEMLLPLSWIVLSLLIVIVLAIKFGWVGGGVAGILSLVLAGVGAGLDRMLVNRTVLEFTDAFPLHSEARPIAVETLNTIAKRSERTFARSVLRQIQPLITSPSPEQQIRESLNLPDDLAAPKPEESNPKPQESKQIILDRTIPLDLEREKPSKNATPSAKQRYIPLDPEESSSDQPRTDGANGQTTPPQKRTKR